ncbi:MAG: ABC transporter permease [Bryobacteraceae bacterium]|nr:ABC transporter permease [Bryobacteraceae bacterium]
MRWEHWLYTVPLRLRSVLFRRDVERELDEELQFHLERKIEEFTAQGLSPAEAREAAIRSMDGLEQRKEECRDARRVRLADDTLQDLRYGLRVLRGTPGFTAVAIATIALAIGANAVAFAAFYSVVLRPLNVPRAESLYSVHRTGDGSGNQSYPDYLDFRDRNRSFEELAAYSIVQAGLDAGDAPSRAWVMTASGNYFDVLGIQPYAGRFFHASDERGPNSAPYVVLSHAYWRNRFHGDRGAIGSVVQVNKHPFTVIGVAPPEFTGTLLFFSPDFFVPMVNQEQMAAAEALSDRSLRSVFLTLGHLKRGVTTQQAAADLNSIGADLERTYPKEHGPSTFALARPSLYGDFMGRPVRAFLTALLLLAGLILLAACANLGSLFAARAADRAREVALRIALGAGRGRILRQLLTEAMLISLAGGALGLWGSIALLGWLRAWSPFPQFPVNVPLAPGPAVYAVALLLALASGLLFGAAPIRQILRTDAYDVIKSGARSTQERRITGRDLLVAAQIAICALLVTSSLVAVRGLARSMSSNFGFHPGNALLVETSLEMAGYHGDSAPAMQKRMIEEIGKLPGVSAAGLVDVPPLFNGDVRTASIFHDDADDLRPANAALRPAIYRVSPDYFRAARTALIAGRDFTWHDDSRAPHVAVVNPEFARRMFGGADRALGRHYKLRDGRRIQVIGLVEEGKYQSLTENPKPAMFVPLLQSPSSQTTMVARAQGDPGALAPAIRSELRRLDPGLPSFIQTWNEGLSLVLFPSRVSAAALGILGAIGAMLSLTGIFGLAAYSVSRRLRELGIRIALGGSPRVVLAAALGRAVRVLAFGSVAGLFLGILATQVLASIVYQATPRDPLVMAGVVVSMLLLGIVATWIPAQRALSVDPLRLLRED